MRNKRFFILAALVCAALATAGIALALTSGGTAAVSATFDATNVVKSVQKSCHVDAGDTYTYTRAVYKGTAVSSDPRLNGPIRLAVQSMVDDTTGVGALLGTWRINADPNPRAAGVIEASVSGGQLSGGVRGHVAAPWGQLFGGVNGGFNASGGFTGANIGAGAGADSATVLTPGACVRALYLP
ncbi:MAG: hypothetical protein QOG85_2543 [Gaiellaceae bacterium]|jgi:hypothetical protein|nr:hypothetical protein [Gaiellaceae bacterium]